MPVPALWTFAEARVLAFAVAVRVPTEAGLPDRKAWSASVWVAKDLNLAPGNLSTY
jgi:hypothetical protein